MFCFSYSVNGISDSSILPFCRKFLHLLCQFGKHTVKRSLKPFIPGIGISFVSSNDQKGECKTMNTNNYTIKSQEALQNAVQIVQSKGQQAIETGHLLKAVMNVGENVTHFIFNKLGVNSNNLKAALDRIVDSYPKVSGGEPYLSSDANRALEKATRLAQEMGDQYVSLEHILLGLLDNRDQVAQLMKDSGLNEKETKEAIIELRKGSKVNSQSAEDSYDALGRYAINLNERARNGKLDPVIGRDDEIRRVLQILSRRTKNNPILIGEPGVGKTAIAEGLAQRIVNGDVPSNLASKQIFSLDM